MRLASLMLESPASQRFIYSLINAGAHHSMGFENGNFMCHVLKSHAPDDVVQAGFKSALQNVINIVSYAFHRTLEKGRTP